MHKDPQGKCKANTLDLLLVLPLSVQGHVSYHAPAALEVPETPGRNRF